MKWASSPLLDSETAIHSSSGRISKAVFVQTGVSYGWRTHVNTGWAVLIVHHSYVGGEAILLNNSLGVKTAPTEAQRLSRLEYLGWRRSKIVYISKKNHNKSRLVLIKNSEFVQSERDQGKTEYKCLRVWEETESLKKWSWDQDQSRALQQHKAISHHMQHTPCVLCLVPWDREGWEFVHPLLRFYVKRDL